MNWVKRQIRKILLGGAGIALAATGTIVTDSAINPYTELNDRFEYDFIQTLPEAGEARVKIMKDEPEVILEKWSGEVAMKIRYKNLAGKQGKRSLFSNRVEWKGAKEEMHVYPLEEGFEIEIVLLEKPATNVFEFEITGAEDLNFFYQPALTQKEIDDGAFRPIEVVGSYAVYHKTQSNHRIGNINYATGKVYHIYRPKVVDDNGVEEWAILDYQGGILSVTVSQSFLDTAVYPVSVDPTFGVTSVGGTDQAFGNNSWRSLKSSIGEDGTVTSMSVYQSDSATSEGDTFHIAVYDDSSGSPNNRKGYSVEGTLALSQFNEVNSNTDFALTTGTYWLTFSQANQAELVYDTGSSVHESDSFDGYVFPREDPHPAASATGLDTEWSIFATYTASGGAAPSFDAVIFNE